LSSGTGLIVEIMNCTSCIHQCNEYKLSTYTRIPPTSETRILFGHYLPYSDGRLDSLSVWHYSYHVDPSHSHMQDTSSNSDMHLM